MVNELPNTQESWDTIAAIVEPKHVWVDANKLVVYTGADIPAKPPVNSEAV